MKLNIVHFLSILFFGGLFTVSAQQKKVKLCEVSGTVLDSISGKSVASATLFINYGKVGIVTDTNGYFSYKLPAGQHAININRLGYRPFKTKFFVNRDTVLNIRIMQIANELDEVVITTQAVDQNITKPILGVSQLSIKTIKKLPAMMGEVDVMRSLQLLPGITSVGEASNGVNVRGGTVDQNLILLDEAPILNPTHLFGLFSVFPPDAVATMDLYKGIAPARYGGRAAAVLDISMANPSLEKFKFQGGIGPVSNRATAEIPLIKSKLSILLSGRVAFNDFWFKLGPPRTKNIRGNFADGAVKLFFKPNLKNTITISNYANYDFFQTELLGGIPSVKSTSTQYDFRTLNVSGKWFHAFGDKLDMQLIGVYSHYQPQTLLPEDDGNVVTISSAVLQKQFKANLNYRPSKAHKIEIGGNVSQYQIDAGKLDGGGNQNVNPVSLPTELSIETAAYVEDEIALGKKTTFSLGTRYSIFRNLGPTTVRYYRTGEIRDEAAIESEKSFAANETANTYGGFEPRLGFRYMLSERASFKMGYNLMRQYLQVITNTTTPLPTSRWKTSDANIKPQVSQLWSMGYFQNLHSNIYELSLEGYYRHTNNIVEYKPGADFLLTNYVETQLLQGQSKSYGFELMLARKKGETTGWISYTYSRVLNQVNEGLSFLERINGGKWFPANFDRPNSLNVSLSTSPNRWHTFSLTFTYATGRPFTAPTGMIREGDRFLPYFALRNNDRIKDYTRLDFSWHIHNPKDRQGKWKGDWVVTVFNLLGRKNQYSVFLQPFEKYFKTYQLTILNVPFASVTYNFDNFR